MTWGGRPGWRKLGTRGDLRQKAVAAARARVESGGVEEEPGEDIVLALPDELGDAVDDRAVEGEKTVTGSGGRVPGAVGGSACGLGLRWHPCAWTGVAATRHARLPHRARARDEVATASLGSGRGRMEEMGYLALFKSGSHLHHVRYR